MLNLMNWDKPIMVNDKTFKNSSEAYEAFKNYEGRLEIKINYKPEKNEGTQTPQTKYKDGSHTTHHVYIPQWLAKRNNCPTVLKGQIERETEKAIYFKGVGLIDNPVNCSVCGRDLTNEISRQLGVGPICAERMFGIGFDRPKDLKQVMEEKTFTLWLPKSQITLR